MVSFFERSGGNFSPSLKHLEEMTEKLVSIKSKIDSNTASSGETISLALEITFDQNTQTNNVMKATLTLDSDEQDKIIEMFTLLRNINTNTTRIDYLNSKYSFNFNLYTLVKLPNTGDPIYGPEIGGLVSQSAYKKLKAKSSSSLTASEQLQMANMKKLYIDASFKLIINTEDYLTKSRDLRWNLQSKNAYASIFGEEDNFYMFVVMSEKSDSSSTGTVSQLF